MQAWNTDRVIEAKAPAKINLFLEVLRKRPDGYHDISSVVVPVSMYDELRFEETQGAIELVCDDACIPARSDNLTVKAAELLRDSRNASKGVKITLKKGIPVGAGLGGGSSDAATTLLALNSLWNLELELESMLSLAAQLGADVPLFLYGRAVHMTGRGEKVVPLENTLGEMNFAIAIPDFGMSTRTVYSRLKVPLDVQRRSASGMIEGLLKGERELVVRNIFNRLTQTACEEEPRLEDIYREITQATELPVAMTGSGSAFFVCCSSREESERVSDLLKGTVEADIRNVSLTNISSCVAGAGTDRR